MFTPRNAQVTASLVLPAIRPLYNSERAVRSHALIARDLSSRMGLRVKRPTSE
jgi:hypothetical protein